MFVRLKMKVLKFSYFDKDDIYDKKRHFRSRIYEYTFVLDFLKDKPKTQTIHNTWCWGWEVHIQFANELSNYWEVINSDNDARKRKFLPPNFTAYDLVNKPTIKTDITLCISTLEHLPPKLHTKVLQNLLDGTNDWWYVICTFDVPPCVISELENFLWVKCKDVANRLSTHTSVIPQHEWDIQCIKLIIQK
jgi:hypothetical protein